MDLHKQRHVRARRKVEVLQRFQQQLIDRLGDEIRSSLRHRMAIEVGCLFEESREG